MAESTAIQQSIDDLHAGAGFIYDVATGPAQGTGSEVQNPAGGGSQSSLAKAISDVALQALFLSSGDASEYTLSGLPLTQHFLPASKGAFAAPVVIEALPY